MGGGASPADARALAPLERVEEPDATAACAICLDDLNYLEAAPVARLPRCSHAFHEAGLLRRRPRLGFRSARADGMWDRTIVSYGNKSESCVY